MFRALIVAVLLVISAIAAQGQQCFVKAYPPTGGVPFGLNSMLDTLPDGGYVLGCSVRMPDSTHRHQIIRTDAFGAEIWRAYTPYTDSTGKFSMGMVTSSDGSTWYAGTELGLEDARLYKFDAQGNLILDVPVQDLGLGGIIGSTWTRANRMAGTSDGGVVLAGYGPADSVLWFKGKLVRMNAQGDTVWTAAAPYDPDITYQAFTSATETSDGSFLVGGYESDTGIAVVSSIAVLFSSTGVPIWKKRYQPLGTAITQLMDVAQLQDGRYLMGQGLATHAGVLLANGNGDTAWTHPVSPAFGVHRVAETTDGAVLGMDLLFRYKLDLQGNELWSHGNVGLINGDLHALPGGKIASTGTLGGQLVLMVTGPDGEADYNQIRGRVFADELSPNCVLDSVDVSLSGITVEADGPVSYYTVTDSAGQYEFNNLLPGSYTVRPHAPYSLFEFTCPADSAYQLDAGADTLHLDLGVNTETDCPLMTVNLGVLRYRRCTNEAVRIYYNNLSPYDAPNSSIEVKLSQQLSAISASLPWNTPQSGQTYTFDLGTVPGGSSGFIDLTVYVSCDTADFGDYACVGAHIYPDSICLPPPAGWEGTELDASGECQNDTVVFTLFNGSPADMINHSGLGIVEDNLMHTNDSVKLDGLEEIWIRLPGRGKTWHLFAEQPEHHPQRSHTFVTVEGCGTNAQGSHSQGIASQFP